MDDLTVTTISLDQQETTTVDPVWTTNENECDLVDTDFLTERFWLCVVIGGSVSIISIIENLFIFFLFATSRQHRNSYNLYLLLLAFFDVFMGISYIALMSVMVMINFTASVQLKFMWASYVVPMLTISHVAMTTSTYLITFAAIERYAITITHRTVDLLQKNRRWFVLLAFAIGLVTKGSYFFELEIQRNETCTDHLNEYKLIPSELMQNDVYRRYFRFHFRTITTVFAPFFFLFLITSSLVFKLNRVIREKNGQMLDVQHVKQKRARIRASTRTLVILIFTYLMSNCLGVVVALWEYVDYFSLITRQFIRMNSLMNQSVCSRFIYFYVISVDIISFLSIVACALRLPIYLSCQPLLRKEARQFLSRLCGREHHKKRLLRNDSTMEREAISASQTLISSPNEKANL
ncbi:hypothetical protein PRIPAC_75435 [Pristionchus pacificus]|uniref:G protein-coupled receptor n=1 Tax=Pristionchus pacificus TaxID=54126 RepID=A0A2A6CRB2_PRIPA|nr:hypothetical protein PRIPAC_75435 [Pristionchus pacificus]|eukprot:PDM80679.1 G protein-coupled receptor [Pristionchus pacificus]